MASQLDQKVQQFLKEPQYACLTTLMRDGSPHTTVVWVDCDGQHILVNTAEGRLKVKNVRRDPRVSICVYDRQNPYRVVLARGRVVEITKTGADEHINRLAKKYLGVEAYPYRAPEEQRLIVKIAPQKLTATWPPS
jgi:PPOX class probable F420-dependent enzyme